MRATRLVPVLIVGLSLLLGACGPQDVSGAMDQGIPAPALSETTPMSDPREYVGPVVATLGSDPIDPITRKPRPQLPVTVIDAQGSTVTITDTRRILALDIYGTLSRTVFDLGLGARLVGRDTSTQFREAAGLPLVTPGGHDLNAEAILSLNPSVVITDTSLGPFDVLLQLRDAGIPVVIVDSHRDLDNVDSLITQVADALGVSAAGKALAARTQAEIAAVTAAIDDVAPQATHDKLRVIFLYVRGQAGVYSMFGQHTAAQALIGALGGYDVAAEIGWEGTKPVTDEGLIAAQPDVILMMTKGLESVGGLDGLAEAIPALAQTPAGQHDRIVAMADNQVLGFGPITAQVLNALAVALYAPDAVA